MRRGLGLTPPPMSPGETSAGRPCGLKSSLRKADRSWWLPPTRITQRKISTSRQEEEQVASSPWSRCSPGRCRIQPGRSWGWDWPTKRRNSLTLESSCAVIPQSSHLVRSVGIHAGGLSVKGLAQLHYIPPGALPDKAHGQISQSR